MDADAVREALRSADDPSLRRRRRIALLSAVGLVDFALISLYQLGVIRRLPDPPGRLWSSSSVNASRSAYPFGVPDGSVAALMHATTLVLAGVGGNRASGRHPGWSALLALVTLSGAGAAVKYLFEMAFQQKRACPYCLLGAAMSFASVAPAVAEARASWRERRGGGR